MTIDFYDRNGDDFFARTSELDVDFLYRPFLALLPAPARILDAGCGSGRDSKAFLQRGYQVTAIDASDKLVRLASEHTGLPVQHMTFSELPFENAFDGIWASATLLHVPHSEMEDVFHKFIRALKIGGVWYMSFKKGEGEKWSGERLFTYFNKASLGEWIARFPALETLQLWEEADSRPEFQNEHWVNALVRRRS